MRTSASFARRMYATLNYFDLLAEREALLARFERLKKELESQKTG